MTLMNPESSFKKYPYFLYPQATALEETTDEKERARLTRRVASLIGDPEALRRLLGMVPAEFMNFYPDQTAPNLGTDDTISSFLEHFGGKTQAAEPTDGEEIPIIPAADYTTMLDRLEEEADAPMPADNTSLAIDSFLETFPSPTPAARPTPDKQVGKKTAEDTEDNVRELIRTKDYRNALEMLSRIQLRSDTPIPWLEDRIRFLRIIINTSSPASS